MRKFYQNILLFSTPFMALIVLELWLDPTFFTFRTWEGISFGSKIPHYSLFYPNTKTFKNSTGDLCHHTCNEIVKPEFWITDKLGFRNDAFIEKADILIIGDSYVAGSSLSQNEIISNRLKIRLETNTKVYNMAPGSFSKLDYFLKTGILKRPGLVIFSIAERNVPEPINPSKTDFIEEKIKRIGAGSNINMYLDRIFRLSSVEWLRARIKGFKGQGLPAKGDSSMFFLKGTTQKHEAGDLEKTVSNIKQYKRYCDSLGIQFVFMPMPDKESVYYELVPFEKQPDYLFQLDSALKTTGITTINTLKIYKDYRKTNNKLLYHKDDTHWNANATELISDEIIRIIN